MNHDHEKEARLRLVALEALALAIGRRAEVADLVWSAATHEEAVGLLGDRFGVDEFGAGVNPSLIACASPS